MKAVVAVPATFLLCYRAWSKKSLTPLGIFFAGLTAIAHAAHPWNLPFVLLVVFFLAGTRVTHVKESVKATFTLPTSGSSPGGEGPRTHHQVLANSVVASVLSLAHAYRLSQEGHKEEHTCFSWPSDLAVVGIMANYACVAADTFSSELGILSRTQPRLITSPMLRKVPRGTNGGVTLWGLVAGLIGSAIVAAAAVLSLPVCAADGWTPLRRGGFALALTVWGLMGSLVDSFLGGCFQRSVRDVRSGKIVEGHGGKRVLVGRLNRATLKVEAGAASQLGEEEDAVERPAAGSAPVDKHQGSITGAEEASRVIENGWDLLDNNDVNFLMALIMSTSAMMAAGWYWDIPFRSMLAA